MKPSPPHPGQYAVKDAAASTGARPTQANKTTLPGSQNEDLKGPKPGRGPRGAST
jgi:hypothetical protein